MRRLLTLWRSLPPERQSGALSDAAVGCGLLLLAAGLAWAWPPLGLIVPGAVLVGLGVWGASR